MAAKFKIIFLYSGLKRGPALTFIEPNAKIINQKLDPWQTNFKPNQSETKKISSAKLINNHNTNYIGDFTDPMSQDIQYPVPVQDFGSTFLDPNPSSQNIQYPSQNIQYPNQNIQYPGLDIQYPIQDIQYLSLIHI